MTEATTIDIPPIDTEAIREARPILNYVLDDIGRDKLTRHKDGYHYGPCPFCRTGVDRFKVWPDSGQFYCRHCEKKGDVIAYVMARRGVDFVSACRWLDASLVPELPKSQQNGRENGAQRPLEGELLEKWRIKADELATAAIFHLLEKRTEAAENALAWLADRGIRGEDCANFGIGYNDHWREILPGYKLPPGITLPRWCPDANLTAINVYLDHGARKMTGNRRMYAAGSRPKGCLFNALRIRKAETVVICEGELDCILLARFLPPHAVSTATGGADMIPDDLAMLDGRRVIVVPDNDEAGDHFVDRWRELLPDCEIARVPEGKDVTDYYRAGGDLAQWIEDVTK